MGGTDFSPAGTAFGQSLLFCAYPPTVLSSLRQPRKGFPVSTLGKICKICRKYVYTLLKNLPACVIMFIQYNSWRIMKNIPASKTQTCKKDNYLCVPARMLGSNQSQKRKNMSGICCVSIFIHCFIESI